MIHKALPDVKATKKPIVNIKAYGSISEIKESTDLEIAVTKSSLGVYLRRIDDRCAVAEKN